MSLINCEINLMLTWRVDCVISAADEAKKSAITSTKPFVPVVPLSTQENAKLQQQFKSGSKITISWNMRKQQALYAHPEASNQDQVGEIFMVFSDEEGKEIILDFSQRSLIVLSTQIC